MPEPEHLLIVGSEKGTLLIGGVNGNWRLTRIVGDGRLTDVFIASNKVGYAVGWDNLVLKTSDGGENWHRIGIPYRIRVSEFIDGAPNYESVVFKDSVTGCVAGWDVGTSIVACTRGGGRNWEVRYPDTEPIGIVWERVTK